jgi:hypothetical protein
VRDLTTRILVCVALAATAAAPAWAAGAADRKEAVAPKTEARERFDRGLKLFEAGDNAAALAEFKRAYDLVPNLVVMYNVGLVYAAMNRPVEAVDALDLALAEGGAKLASDDQRRKARQVRDEQSSRIARVMVISDRPATIEIDGVEAGTTPLREPLRVASGAHTISLLATGYLPTHRQLMFAGQITETLTLSLTPAETTTAHLTVTASVPGADVLVNGKVVGATPLPASIAVAPGRAEVELRRAGYRRVARSISLDEGASGAVDVVLEEDPTAAAPRGRLRLAFEEPGAQVAVDGVVRPLGADGTLALPAGPHELRVQRAGYEPAARTVAIVAETETPLAVRLAPSLETRAKLDDSAHTRRVTAAAILGGGLLIAAGATVYAIATRHAISDAQTDLDTYLLREANPVDVCYHGTNPPPMGNKYDAAGCGPAKAGLEDNVDTAKLRRNLAYGAAALGAVAAGVGTYLLVSGPGKGERAHEATSQISFWGDGRSGGLTLLGRF